jgi:hypothetical protein
MTEFAWKDKKTNYFIYKQWGNKKKKGRILGVY